ncbi:MAG: flavodoxin family protein [Nitrososphaeria archaeon]|jgi:multimeric flavodoxin WrbA
MLILGVSGSPRVKGNTDLILQEALAAAKKQGANVKLIYIKDYSLQPCNACRTCFRTKKCVIDDDGEKVYKEILEADGIILASPSYFQGVTAQMKVFIDRIGYLALARGRKDFTGKVGGVIAVARRSGLMRTCDQMITFITAVRMIIPSGGRVFAIGNKRGEVAKDKEGIKGARYLGKMMAKTIAVTHRLRKSKST